MMRSTLSDVVGAFDDQAEADGALDELKRAGFPSERIEVWAGEEAAQHAREIARPRVLEKGYAVLLGLVVGVIGCLIGTLVGSLGLIEGIYPLLQRGPVAGILGAIIGAAVGALFGALIGWSFAADENSFYADQFRSGQILIAVHGNGRAAAARTILRRHQAHGVPHLGEAPAKQ
jgi:hypothetical protein